MKMKMTEDELRKTEIHVRVKSGAGPHFDRQGEQHEQNGPPFAINGLELKSFSDKFDVEPGDRSLAEKILNVDAESETRAAVAAMPAALAKQEEADEQAGAKHTTGRTRPK